MPKDTVVLYANCQNDDAFGDFTFAGVLAQNLMLEIKKQNLSLDVILVSTKEGIPRFEKLYGQAIDGSYQAGLIFHEESI